MTTTLSDGRLPSTSLSRPKSTSVASVRSWASSSTMTEYRSISGSVMASRSSMPSVMYLRRASATSGGGGAQGCALEHCFRAAALLETNGIANLLPNFHVHLLRHASRHRHGGHAARLRAGHALAGPRKAGLNHELRNLCTPGGARQRRQVRSRGEPPPPHARRVPASFCRSRFRRRAQWFGACAASARSRHAASTPAAARAWPGCRGTGPSTAAP